mgnify:CR=1 FL=1|jgi:hypothetical protein
MKKNILFMFLYCLLISVFISCQWGLSDLEANDECEIIDFNFEKRTIVKEERIVKDTDGNEIKYYVDRVVFVPGLKSSIAINTDQNIVTVTIKPEADLNSIVGYAVISPGAKIEPIEGSPVLGVLGNFSTPQKYKVTAANGINSKIWEVKASIPN